MRAFLVAAAVMGVVASTTHVGLSQAKTTIPSIEGVWKGTSQAATGPDANSIPARQPNIVIYTKKYFSRIAAEGPSRPVLAAPKDPAKLTDAEKLARYEHWRQFAPVAGTYVVKGTQYFQPSLVAKDQDVDIIARNAGKEVLGPAQEIQFEGSNTLVLTGTSADGKTVTRRTYTRLNQPSATGTKPHPIEGVWRVTSSVATGANPSANPNRLPGIFIYKNGYYTNVAQDGNIPSPPRPVLAAPKDAAKLTNAEKLARYEHWAPGVAAAGRYEVKGTTLYQYVVVGKNQTADVIARNKTGKLGTVAPNSELAFSNGNNTMVQIATSADGKTVTRRTYTRLE